jgi:hypothetical protein
MRGLALAVGAGCLWALFPGAGTAADARIGAAALDPGKIPGFVRAMPPADTAAFVKRVVVAASRLPVAPQERVKRIADVLGQALETVPADAQPAVIANGLAAIPYSMLPAAVDLLVPRVAKITGSMDDAAYGALLVKTVAAVDGLQLSRDDKSIVMTFAIVLLARAKPQGKQDELIRTALQAVPESYRSTVQQMVAAALRGDYAAIFGPTAEVLSIIPDKKAPATVSLTGQTMRDDVLRSFDESIYIDVGLERPSIPIEGEPKPSTSTSSVPPIPKPYSGQWL